MSIVTLSGWGQPHDALSSVFEDSTALDYAVAGSVEEALALIEREAAQAQAVIGWSLGGQLLVRAIAEKRIAPKSLVLIAAPYRFVASPQDELGMGRDTYRKFRDNYARNPERTLAKAWELAVMGDGNEDDVREIMRQYDMREQLGKPWLHWLDMLGEFSCEGLRMEHFPPTLLIHGGEDAVVDVEQSHRFAEELPQAMVVVAPEAGHAPHWHSPSVEELVHEFIDTGTLDVDFGEGDVDA